MMQQVKIGHYTLGKTIGSGGFAKVKRAKHDLTGLDVAVKIINKKKMKNKNMISKVKREIKILKFINHPNIIKLYEVLDTTNDIFVIMELASKGELYENIQNSPINEDRARFYFKQIINGIEYIHQNHITHRDLKPQNILIDQNDLIKIGDFGLSNLMKDGKLLKTSCGSLSYAAPEIVGQRKYQGTSIDIWSTGVILYALLTGSLPFDQDNITLLHKKIQQGSYKRIPSSVNLEAKDLIERMLQVDPRKRIKISEIKFHPWITSKMPIYSKITDQFLIEKIHQFEVDEEILKQVKGMNLGFHEFSEEKVKKSITKRDDHSFVIAYELLKSQNDRRLYAEVQEDLHKPGNAIFQNIQNYHLPQHLETIDVDDKRYIYGQHVKLPLKPLIQKILHLLESLSIQYVIKSADYCLKCCYKKSNEMNEQEEKEEKKEKEESSEEQKFSKNILKFILQIYAVNKQEKLHVVDLQLTQGHPLVFFPLARKIYKEICHDYYH